MMNETAIAKYDAMLARALSALDGRDATQRSAGYDRLRRANEAMLSNPERAIDPEAAGHLRARLETLIADHDRAASAGPETEHGTIKPDAAPAVAANSSGAAGGTGGPAVLGIALGAFAAIALFTGLWVSGIVTVSAAQTSASSAAGGIEKAYLASLPQVDVAVTFLETVREEIEERQKSDPAGLTRVAGKKFVPLKAIAPELDAAQPKSLPGGSRLIVRADDKGYKLLFNWPLCATVQQTKPEMIDPRRDRKVLGCSHFGVWNEAAAKW